MYLEKIKIKNFKKIINLETELNKNINIFFITLTPENFICF